MRLRPYQTAAVFPVLVFLVAVVPSSGETVLFFNDFSDGNDNGWGHVDNTISPWGPGVFDASSGSYILETTGTVPENPPGISDTVFSLWDVASDPRFDNGFLRAKVHANTDGTTFMLLLRVTGGNGYAFSGDTNFSISRVDSAASTRLQELDPPPSPIVPGEDWIIEVGAVGSRLSMKVWRDGDLEPQTPQLIAVDSNYSEGSFFAVGVRKDSAFQEAGQVSATFDDVTFFIPEPSTLLLALVTLGVAGGWRKWGG